VQILYFFASLLLLPQPPLSALPPSIFGRKPHCASLNGKHEHKNADMLASCHPSCAHHTCPQYSCDPHQVCCCPHTPITQQHSTTPFGMAILHQRSCLSHSSPPKAPRLQHSCSFATQPQRASVYPTQHHSSIDEGTPSGAAVHPSHITVASL